MQPKEYSDAEMEEAGEVYDHMSESERLIKEIPNLQVEWVPESQLSGDSLTQIKENAHRILKFTFKDQNESDYYSGAASALKRQKLSNGHSNGVV